MATAAVVVAAMCIAFAMISPDITRSRDPGFDIGDDARRLIKDFIESKYIGDDARRLIKDFIESKSPGVGIHKINDDTSVFVIDPSTNDGVHPLLKNSANEFVKSLANDLNVPVNGEWDGKTFKIRIEREITTNERSKIYENLRGFIWFSQELYDKNGVCVGDGITWVIHQLYDYPETQG